MLRKMIERGWRQMVLLGCLAAFSGTVVSHLFYWQVAEHAAVAAETQRQFYNQETINPAPRGLIVDARYNALVTNQSATLVAVDPYALTDSIGASRAPALARSLASILHLPLAQVQAALTPRGNIKYIQIAPQVDDAKIAAIQALGKKSYGGADIYGLRLKQVWRRSYPNNKSAAAILGFVDSRGVGRYGVEYQYNKWLSGQDGIEWPIVSGSSMQPPQQPRPVKPGDTLQLTIDSAIQGLVERRLMAAISKFKARGGTAIVLDPRTGAIMAMASLPSFDPANYQATANSDPTLFANQALQNYPPGSTFKTISVAAGLDSNSFNLDTTVNDTGALLRYDNWIYNWTHGTGWGIETPEKMLQHSANIGMAQFAEMIGPQAFYTYLGRFGFDIPTGVDLPGEASGLLRSPLRGDHWGPLDLLVNSYGQSIDVTPLQLVAAVASLANGGARMRPYIVQRVLDPSTNATLWSAQPHVVNHPVSSRTAATMTGLLQRSAVDGEATCALTADEPVAAKTGTSSIDGVGQYGQNLSKGTIASLIGYAPANDPRFVMLVTLDRPDPGKDGFGIYGSVAAAPAWHDIALGLYKILNIAPQSGVAPGADKLAALQGPNDWNCGFMSHIAP